MQKIGKTLYPDNMGELVKDKALLKIFRFFLKKRYASENLDFYLWPFNPESFFKTFMSEETPTEISMDGQTIRDSRALAASKDWVNPKWRKIFTDAKALVRLDLESDSMPAFYASDMFKAYHTLKKGDASLEPGKVDPALDVGDVPPAQWLRAATTLKIKDHFRLKEYIQAYEKDGPTKSHPLAERLLKAEGKTWEVEKLNKLLGSLRAMHVRAAYEPSSNKDKADEKKAPSEEPTARLKIDKRKLTKVGFENLNDIKKLSSIECLTSALMGPIRAI